MRFPEFLFRLNTQDEGKQQLVVAYGELDTGVQPTGDVGGTVYTVPLDKVLVLCSACMQCRPAVGGVLLDEMRVLVSTPQADRQWEVAYHESDASAAAPFHVLNWSGEIVVPPGYRVRASTTFSGGAGGGTTRAACQGVLIPRGSFTFDA